MRKRGISSFATENLSRKPSLKKGLLIRWEAQVETRAEGDLLSNHYVSGADIVFNLDLKTVANTVV